jgi:acetyl esterase/lipase
VRALFAASQPLLTCPHSLLSPFIELNFPPIPKKASSLARNRAYDFVDPANIAYFATLFSGIAKCAFVPVSLIYCAECILAHRPSDQASGLATFVRRKTAFALLYPARSPSPAAQAVALQRRRRSSPAESLHALHCKADALLSPGDHAAKLLHPSVAGAPRVPTLVLYGTGEVLADQSERLLAHLGDAGTAVKAANVHAWPLVAFYLGRNERERASGVLGIAEWVVGQV